MQNEEHLNNLFNLAKEQEVLLNSNEIQGLMNGRQVKTPADKYQKFKTTKFKVMTISTLILSIAATIGFFVNSNQKAYKKPTSKIDKTTIESLKNSLTEIEKTRQVPISSPDITYTTKPKFIYEDTGKRKKSIAKSELEPKTTSNSFDKNTFVVLTREELKKLGIYIKDDVFMYEMNDTRLGDFKTYFGDKVAERSEIWQTPKQNPGGTNPLAMFTTTLNGEIKNVLGIFQSPSKIEAEAIANNLLPVWVEDENSNTKKTYIAWFEINDKLLSLLPVTVKSNIENNKDFYMHSLQDLNLTTEEHKSPIKDTSYFSSINIVSIDNEQIITPDNTLLKKLGFNSVNPIIYSRKKNGNRLYIKHSTNKFTEIDFHFENKDSINTNIENTYPVFMTNYDPRTQKVFDISYLYEYSDLMKSINIPVLFNNSRFNIIGLKVEGNIFWYYINDILLNELNPEDKRRIQNYAEANKDKLKGININAKLPNEKSFAEIAGFETPIDKSFAKETFVNLTKDELKRLGIYIKGNVFMYEMKYTKLGNIKFSIGDKPTDYIHITSSYNPPKRKNPLAVLITNANGDIIKPIAFTQKYTDDSISIKRSKRLLPVWVQDETSIAGRPYIAWFEINDTLYNFLPERIQRNLKSNKTFYSHSLTDKNKRKGDVIYPKQNITIDISQIVIPDESLLKKLGFESSKPIVYFRHTEKGGQLSIDYRYDDARINIGVANQDNSKQSISNMFPEFWSSYNSAEQNIFGLTAIRELTLDYNELNEFQDFNNKKFGMIGLWIKGDTTDHIFWYSINKAILNELKPEDRIRISKYAEANEEKLKSIDLNTKLPEEKSFEEVANNKINNSAAIKTITLSEAQLSKLLISVIVKKIIHKIYVGKNTETGDACALQIVYDKLGSQTTYPVPINNFDTSSYVCPVMLTDDLGQYARSTISIGDKSYDLNKISSYNLIPVLVKSGDEYTTMDQLTKKARPDIIFWYEPTEKFLKILDNKTANEIRNDIEALTCSRSKITFTNDSTCDGKNTLSCNYFEACQNTKSKAITKYSVFPNPARDNFNLKLDLKEECSVLVYMFALNGDEVKQFQIGKMKKGISQKELSSAGITPGLYLLRITTDKGDIFNERILIKE